MRVDRLLALLLALSVCLGAMPWARADTDYPPFQGIVADVADVLAQIAARRLAGTWHWSGTEPLTKFDMATVTARLAGVDSARLVRSGAPANGSEPRPKDCHLDRSALEQLGVTATGRLFEPTVRGLLQRFAF